MFQGIDESTFKSQVLESPGPVLVHFRAPWCKLCQAIEPTLLQFQEHCPQPLKLVSVNADASLKLVNTYRVKILPTLLWFEGGELLDRLEGFQGREELYLTLQNIPLKRLATIA